MEFTEVIRNRFACKKFGSRKVERKALEEILEAGRLAPTAKNLQEQKIYVLESEEALAKFDKATPCRYGAQTVLIVAFDKNNTFTYPGGKRNSGIEDASIVVTHMILAAENAGRSVFSEDYAAVFKKDLDADARADLESVSHLYRKHYSSEFIDLSDNYCAFHVGSLFLCYLRYI